MTTRKLGRFSLLAFSLALLCGGALTQQGMTAPKSESKESYDSLQSCAKACADCQRACDTCVTHCAQLLSQGKKEYLSVLMTCQDCATVCAAAAQIAARGGPLAGLICESCAKACDDCAKACDKYSDDKQMKACADECRKCEKACRSMVKQVANK